MYTSNKNNTRKQSIINKRFNEEQTEERIDFDSWLMDDNRFKKDFVLTKKVSK